MSHFLALVRITATEYDAATCSTDIDPDVVKSILKEKMEPFYEGHEKGSKYVKFIDKTDECNETYHRPTDFYKDPQGSLYFLWDSRLEKMLYPGWDSLSFSPEGGAEPLPEGWEKVELPLSAKYEGKTFAVFVEEYFGYTSKMVKGEKRYGYYSNPNAKWDWYVIGGRWKGALMIRPDVPVHLGESGSFGNEVQPGHRGDMAFGRDLDRAGMETAWKEKTKKAYDEYRELIDSKGTKKYGPFEGPREMMLSLGLCTVFRPEGEKSKPDLNANQIAVKWDDASDEEQKKWYDVYTIVSWEEFEASFSNHFHPLRAYAVLDGEDWREPGEMGWFGMSHAEVEGHEKYRQWFVKEFLPSIKDDDVLVAVDCHI